MADLFVAGNQFPDESCKLVNVYRLTCVRHDESLGDLARLKIGHTEDSTVSHARMFEQHSLELGRGNAETLVLDHFLLAINYVEVALVVDPANVSRIQPSVAQHTGGLFRSVPISLHDLRTADYDFADF